MRALLVCPEFPLSFWSFRKAVRFRGNKTPNPPLGLLTVAALLPLDWDLRLADLNTRSLTEEDWQWADLVLISAMYIQRAGLLALVREAKLRGKTVVAGGPHPTSLPEAGSGEGRRLGLRCVSTLPRVRETSNSAREWRGTQSGWECLAAR